MKGYIAQEMGKAIDWAAVAATIAKELDRQDGSKKSSASDFKPRASEFHTCCPNTNRGANCSQLMSIEFGGVFKAYLHPTSPTYFVSMKEHHEFLFKLQNEL